MRGQRKYGCQNVLIRECRKHERWNYKKFVKGGGVKLIHKRSYAQYTLKMRERGKGLPDFTLLTSDCMGGLIYHTLGRRFLSPTINMSINDSDFLKLLTDLKYYFSRTFLFLPYGAYPIGLLGEGARQIEVRFEHYREAQEAAEKWNDRKKRIAKEIYIIMADDDLSDGEIVLFKSLEKYLNVKRKIMFTWNEERADGKEIIHIKKYGRQRIKNYSKLRKDGKGFTCTPGLYGYTPGTEQAGK